MRNLTALYQILHLKTYMANIYVYGKQIYLCMYIYTYIWSVCVCVCVCVCAKHDKINGGFPDGTNSKEPLPMQVTQETQVRSLGQEEPSSRKWQPALIFLPAKLHGQRSLAGYSPLGCKESGMTECLITHTHTQD